MKFNNSLFLIMIALFGVFMCCCSKESKGASSSSASNIKNQTHSQKSTNTTKTDVDEKDTKNIKFSFSASTYLLITGEPEAVFFDACIEPLEIVNGDITVYDGENNVIGIMEKDNRGFFTLCVKLSSDTEKTVEYYAKFDDYKSEKISISFFESCITSRSDTETQEEVCKGVSDVIEEYKSKNGTITLNNFDGAVSAISFCLDEYQKKSVIKNYSIEGYTVLLKLSIGYNFIISVIPDGVD